MNLTYIRDYLSNRVDNLTKEDVQSLIEQIDLYQGTENKFADIASIMRVVNEYNLSFLSLVQSYEALPKNDIKTLPVRMERVREILCTLSSLHTYLVLSSANVKESTFNMKNIRSYMSELSEKKEHFKSEKMTWASVLRSLTQETAYVMEMRKMDIEDKVGYLKYSGGSNG